MTLPALDGSMASWMPSLGLQQAYLWSGWAVVLAAGLRCVLSLRCWQAIARRWPRGWQVAPSALLVALCLWHGEDSPAYGLGLCFQSPSLTLVLFAAWYGWWPKAVEQRAAMTRLDAACLLAVAAALYLDRFRGAWLPLWPDVYAWGWHEPAWTVLAALLLAAYVAWAGALRRPIIWVLSVALLLQAATGLPTGNGWDAVLDPWWCVALLVVLLKRSSRAAP